MDICQSRSARALLFVHILLVTGWEHSASAQSVTVHLCLGLAFRFGNLMGEVGRSRVSRQHGVPDTPQGRGARTLSKRIGAESQKASWPDHWRGRCREPSLPYQS